MGVKIIQICFHDEIYKMKCIPIVKRNKDLIIPITVVDTVVVVTGVSSSVINCRL